MFHLARGHVQRGRPLVTGPWAERKNNDNHSITMHAEKRVFPDAAGTSLNVDNTFQRAAWATSQKP